MEITHMWLRNIWIVLVAILFVMVMGLWHNATAQTTVYTNVGPSVIVKEERHVRPAPSIPDSIRVRADELRLLGEWRSLPVLRNAPRVPNVPAQPTSERRTPVSEPLIIDGLYVGPSPSGSWTSVVTKIPTVRVIR